MFNKQTKSFLEIYGLIRMIIGTAQLVGLSAGYFLIEWIVRYPKIDVYYLFDRDLVSVIYLAVILRALFQIIVGIGIARLRDWARSWILFGWPVALIISCGLIYSIAYEWKAEGIITTFSEIIIVPKLLVFGMVVLFDYIFVNKAIDQYNYLNVPTNIGVRMEAKKVGFVLFFSVLFFCLLLYVGKPIRQGFHKGFYKLDVAKSTKGDKKTTLKTQLRKSIKEEEVKSKIERDSISKKLAAPRPDAAETEKLKKASGQANAREAMVYQEKKKDIKKGIPFTDLIGYVGGFGIIFGLIFQALEMGESRKLSPPAYVLLSLGFLLLTIYGVSTNIFIIILTSLISFLLCLSILLKCKLDS